MGKRIGRKQSAEKATNCPASSIMPGFSVSSTPSKIRIIKEKKASAKHQETQTDHSPRKGMDFAVVNFAMT